MIYQLYPNSVPKKVDPQFAREVMLAGGWEPLETYKNATTPWKAKCLKCGLIGKPTFANVQRGSGCSICKNKQKIVPRKLSESTAVDLMLKARMKPLVPYENTKVPWKSICLVCNKITSPSLGNIIQGHNGCGYCDGHKVDPLDAFNKMQSVGLEPLEPFKDTTTPWKCLHKACGEIVQPTYSSIRSGQGGCRKCGFLEGAKKQTLTHEKAELVMLAAKLMPLEPYTKSERPWSCECLVCGKIVKPSYSNVASGNNGCLYCAGSKVDSEDAIATMRANGLEPLEPYIDSKKPWKSLHLKCGNIVFPKYNTIQTRGGGCSTCAEYGLTYSEPAYLYIMLHEVYKSIKIGISNNDSSPNRVKIHQQHGWLHFKNYYFSSGQLAEDIENEVLNWLRRDKKLGVHLSKNEMPQKGYSETVDSNEITVYEIESYLVQTIKNKT